MGRHESRKEAEKFVEGTTYILAERPKLKSGNNYAMTEEELFIHFQAYIVETKSNPFLVMDFGMTKEGAQIVKMEKERPLSVDGFSVFLWERNIYRGFRNIVTNPDGIFDNLAEVVSYIREVIRRDQVEGGLAGVYNQTLTARLNNITEKSEVVNTSKNYTLTMNLK